MVRRRVHSSVAGSPGVLLVKFTVTFLVAKVSYDWFELRLLRGKRRFAYDAEEEAKKQRLV